MEQDSLRAAPYALPQSRISLLKYPVFQVGASAGALTWAGVRMGDAGSMMSQGVGQVRQSAGMFGQMSLHHLFGLLMFCNMLVVLVYASFDSTSVQ
ncbi:hypothetical protein ID856_14055 [Xenorhabdus sp. 18]|uniref:hypothetical protein n=1 Tax=Xenorhabdus doucetiae TaxID=351671 RepID=UPI0019BA08BF|nr:hypothetical protein [Xenorhabdus sp. 18]MBD2797652.1 hypothetical protein [Xenorhabdus sp. 18]